MYTGPRTSDSSSVLRIQIRINLSIAFSQTSPSSPSSKNRPNAPHQTGRTALDHTFGLRTLHKVICQSQTSTRVQKGFHTSCQCDQRLLPTRQLLYPEALIDLGVERNLENSMSTTSPDERDTHFDRNSCVVVDGAPRAGVLVVSLLVLGKRQTLFANTVMNIPGQSSSE